MKKRANRRPDFESDVFWKKSIVSYISLKKKEEAKTVSFRTAPYVFFFPWTRREQGKKKHLSPAFLLSLFLQKPQKDTDKDSPLAQVLTHGLSRGKKNRGDVPIGQSWGGCIAATPATLPLCHD
jgi:hypothetical protein